MYCGHCAAPLPEAAQFCQSCGYRVIHPDDPEAARFLAEQARADVPRTPAPTPPPVTPPAPVPTPSPRPGPTPTKPPKPRTATPAPSPAAERVGEPRILKVHTSAPTTPVDLDEEWDDEPEPAWRDRRIIAAAVAAAAVLLILLTYVLFGRGDDTPTPATSPTKSATLSPTASAKPSSTPKATAVKLPAGAEKCTEATAALPYTTYRGSSVTTCRFADKVREEYVAAGAPTDAFKAKSPVTGRTYDMVCTGSPLLTCKGGSNAVVYLVKK